MTSLIFSQQQMAADTSQVLGSMTIQDGQIIKADGEMVNAERVANLVQRMVAVGPLFPPLPQSAASQPQQIQSQQTTGTSGAGEAMLVDISADENASPPHQRQHPPPPPPPSVFDQLSIIYPDHQYDIVLGSGTGAGSPIALIGGAQRQQKQVLIHVVKRTRHLAD